MTRQLLLLLAASVFGQTATAQQIQRQLGDFDFRLGTSSSRPCDSYLGFKQRFNDSLGYEVGLIHYSLPNIAGGDSYALYGGLSLLGSRFGGALRNNPDNRTGILFDDLGQLPLLDAGITFKAQRSFF